MKTKKSELKEELQKFKERFSSAILDPAASDFTREKKISDFEFDSYFSELFREHAAIHFTPVEVVKRGVHFLNQYRLRNDLRSTSGSFSLPLKILDVGSGCGKFCIVGGLFSSPEFHFYGVEDRGVFSEESKRLVNFFQLQNAFFKKADALRENFNDYDVLYFFNPFYEHVLPVIQIGYGVQYSEETYRKRVSLTEEKLQMLEVGKMVMTYNGFGGDFPENFKKIESIFVGSAFLECWVKEKDEKSKC